MACDFLTMIHDLSTMIKLLFTIVDPLITHYSPYSHETSQATSDCLTVPLFVLPPRHAVHVRGALVALVVGHIPGPPAGAALLGLTGEPCGHGMGHMDFPMRHGDDMDFQWAKHIVDGIKIWIYLVIIRLAYRKQ